MAQSAVLLLVFAAVFLLVVGGGQLAAPSAAIRRRLEGGAPGIAQAAAPTLWAGGVNDAAPARWLRTLAGLFDPGEPVRQAAMLRRLSEAGYNREAALPMFLALRGTLGLGLPLLLLLVAPWAEGGAWLSPRLVLAAAVSGAAGLYLPNLWVARRGRLRRDKADAGFADAMDMMLVCVEAGLGLDAAIMRVAEEMRFCHPLLAEQFDLVGLELRAGGSRATALRNFADRLSTEDVRSFVTLLLQSDSLGTSIGQALRVHAEEMRQKRAMRAEEKANSLPVKLAGPLIMGILPALLLLVMTPAVIRIVRSLMPTLGAGQ